MTGVHEQHRGEKSSLKALFLAIMQEQPRAWEVLDVRAQACRRATSRALLLLQALPLESAAHPHRAKPLLSSRQGASHQYRVSKVYTFAASPDEYRGQRWACPAGSQPRQAR